MRTIKLDKNAPTLSPNVATIGFFDGVHRGHRFLIEQVKDVARRAGLLSTVITFDQHPRQALHNDYVPQLLSTLDEKLLLLSKMGIDNTVVLHFDAEMAALSAREFMSRVLKEQLSVGKLIIGYDNRFGCGRTDGFEEYVRYGEEIGIEVLRAEALTVGTTTISSSAVRRLLHTGDVKTASSLLGYDYTIGGTVISGCHEGSKMGFPTANIDAQKVQKLIPANGVYAVKVRIDSAGKEFFGMMNIGRRPTFAGSNTTIETHVFDFNGDLYGHHINISLCQWLRDERPFTTPTQLAWQLAEDKKNVERIFKNNLS